MIITHLEIDNLYGFSETKIDFSFKRKNLKSNIPNEYLKERPKFNFKRICIISGTNASGKTSLGKVICGIENFIARKTVVKYLDQAICNKNKPAVLAIEFVTPSNNKLHSLRLSFEENIPVIKKLNYVSIDIGVNDSCSSAQKN